MVYSVGSTWDAFPSDTVWELRPVAGDGLPSTLETTTYESLDHSRYASAEMDQAAIELQMKLKHNRHIKEIENKMLDKKVHQEAQAAVRLQCAWRARVGRRQAEW